MKAWMWPQGWGKGWPALPMELMMKGWGKGYGGNGKGWGKGKSK